MWINKLFMMHLNVGRKRWIVSSLISILILHLRRLIWDAFWYTFILIFTLICKFSIEVACKRRINLNKLSNSILITLNLVFEKFTVSQINVHLKFIYFKALHYASLNVTKKVGHFVDAVFIFYIDKISLRWLPAILTLSGILGFYGETNLTKDAIAIKNEPANGFETSLTFIAVHLWFLIHR